MTCGGDLAGLHGVGDALAVERVDHAAGVADQQHAVGVVRLAVEAHRQRGAAHRLGAVLVAEAPLLRRLVQPALEQVLVVDLAPRRAGVEDAEADVAGAVADAEDPAVAGQQAARLCRRRRGPTAPATTPASRRRAAGSVVGAHRHAHRPVVALLAAPSPATAGWSCRRRPRPAAPSRSTAPFSPLVVTPAIRPALSSTGPVHRGALAQHRAGLDRLPGQQVVEVAARPDQAVRRVAGELGPRDLQPHAAADDPQALVVQPAGLLARCRCPSTTSDRTARGVRPSPQTFSRGNAVFSSSSTSWPARARW